MKFGNEYDIESIYDAVVSGVKLLLTAHGNDINDLPKELIDKKIFKNIIFLEKNNVPGKIKKICVLESEKYVVNC